MDKIKIQNLEVFGKHGVFQEENTLGQKFLVNAVLYTCLLYTSQSVLKRGDPDRAGTEKGSGRREFVQYAL